MSKAPKLWIWAGMLFLSAAAAGSIWAQNLRVEYTEGLVELATTSGWSELTPGEVLPLTARIRLDRDSFAELSQGATRVAVSQPGTYRVGDLLNSSKKVASWQLADVVGGKIKGAVSSSRQSGTAVMAVRGDKVGESAGVEWIEAGAAEEAIARAKTLMDSGRYDEALAVLQKALEEAYAGEEGSLLYYQAEVYSRQGRTALALRALNRVKIAPQQSLYTEMVLLKGRLLLESLAFNDALELFESQLRLNPEGELAQALLIMSSYSYRGLGLTSGARESLKKAQALNSSSELGREAARLLEGL